MVRVITLCSDTPVETTVDITFGCAFLKYGFAVAFGGANPITLVSVSGVRDGEHQMTTPPMAEVPRKNSLEISCVTSVDSIKGQILDRSVTSSKVSCRNIACHSQVGIINIKSLPGH